MVLDALLAVTPSPAPTLGVPEDAVTPGVIGFVAILLVTVATILLIVDMVRRVRRVRYGAARAAESERAKP